MTGLLAYHYLRGLGRLRARTGFTILALTHHTAAARLLAERRAILVDLERAKTDFLAARDVAPPTPRTASAAPLPSVKLGSSAAASGRDPERLR